MSRIDKLGVAVFAKEISDEIMWKRILAKESTSFISNFLYMVLEEVGENLHSAQIKREWQWNIYYFPVILG